MLLASDIIQRFERGFVVPFFLLGSFAAAAGRGCQIGG
jgi:hypothetical protein